MSFDVSLRDINVGMPHTRGDMYAEEGEAVYLIKVPIFVLIVGEDLFEIEGWNLSEIEG